MPEVQEPEVHEQGVRSYERTPCSVKPALTYFRVSTIIGPGCLTAVFEMGTGVSRRVWAPAIRLNTNVLSPLTDAGRERRGKNGREMNERRLSG